MRESFNETLFNKGKKNAQDPGIKLLDLVEVLQVDILPFVINSPKVPIKLQEFGGGTLFVLEQVKQGICLIWGEASGECVIHLGPADKQEVLITAKFS